MFDSVTPTPLRSSSSSQDDYLRRVPVPEFTVNVRGAVRRSPASDLGTAMTPRHDRTPAPWSVPHGLRPRVCPDAPRLAPLGAAIEAAAALDVDTAAPRLLADEVIALLAFVDRLHAVVLQRLARVDAHGVAERESGTSTASWLRHHSGLASGTASDLVRTSRTIRNDLPATGEALARGEITVQHARTISRTARMVDEQTPEPARGEAVQRVEEVMLTVARAVDAGSLGGFATRVRQVVDPSGALADANHAHERRWLTTSTTLDGMLAIDGLLDAESGSILLTALSAASAAPTADDNRSAGQRRADALVDLCRQTLDVGGHADATGARPHLLVTAPLAALTPEAPLTRDSDVAEVAWTGPITDDAARRIACDADVTRVLLGPASLPLDVGRSTRTIPAQIRKALIVRDRGCVADGCDRPANWTDAHHVVHWAEGGRTALDNLVLLCRAHHRKIHDGGWHFEQIGERWKVVPPPDARLRYALDPGTDPAADDEGDAGGHSPQHQLPEP